MAAFCHHCGTAIADEEKRCTQCGATLSSPSSSNGKPEMAPPTPLAPAPPQETPEELVRQALRLMEEGAYDDAIRLCRRAIALNPQMAPAHALLGDLYERVGEPSRALGAYEQALAIDPNYEPAKLGKARSAQSQGMSPPPPPTAPSGSSLWLGHPLPLLAATALVVTVLFAVRTVVPPPPPSAPSNVPNSPILLMPSPTTPMPQPSAPPPVQEAMRKGLDALNHRDYERAMHWFSQAVKQDPNNNEARSWLMLAQAMHAESRTRSTPSVVTQQAPALVPSVSAPSAAARPKGVPSTLVSPQWTWQPRGEPSPPPPSPSLRPQPSPRWTPPPPSLPSPPVPIRPDTPLLADAPAPPPAAPPPSSEELEQRAGQQALQGNLVAAADLYRMALTRLNDPNREGYLRQQLALTLQQLGRYDEAAAEYERAITAYRQQIQRGVQVDAAQRGIEACQRGLEICHQAL